jgi:hypothetical protein
MAQNKPDESAKKKIHRVSQVLAVLVSLIVLGTCIYLGVGPWSQEVTNKVHQAQKAWRIKEGSITKVTSRYSISGKQENKSVVEYSDWRKETWETTVELPGSPYIGEKVGVLVNKKAEVVIPAAENGYSPLNVNNEAVLSGITLGLSFGALGAVLMYYLSYGLLTLKWRLRHSGDST